MTNLTNRRDDGSVGEVMGLRHFNLYEAKTQLSALVEAASAGQEIVISKAGKPKCKLVPLRAAPTRTPGRAAKAIWVSPDFDAPLPADILKGFGVDS